MDPRTPSDPPIPSPPTSALDLGTHIHQQMDLALLRVQTCLQAIAAKHGRHARGVFDKMPCPTGCGGTLVYMIGVRTRSGEGKCSTDGCAAWVG